MTWPLMINFTKIVCAALALVAATDVVDAAAQSAPYPSKPIKLIVAFSAGVLATLWRAS